MPNNFAKARVVIAKLVKDFLMKFFRIMKVSTFLCTAVFVLVFSSVNESHVFAPSFAEAAT